MIGSFLYFFFFFFNDTATTEIYTLSLHDALPIWEHRERQLQAQDHLAQDEQLGRAALPEEDSGERGRHNRDQPGDEPPQPRPDPDVQEAFHHDLTRERPCERRVLARREQRQREYGARPGHAQERREQLV